jgi:REP element-mobilizing transposase RayT
MKFYPGEIYHVYNRGNIHQKIFFERRNYPFFLRKMEKHLTPYCHLLAWCLMPNHFHWLIQIKKKDKLDSRTFAEDGSVIDLNKSIGILLRSYTRAINKSYKNSGSLFQQGTKSKNVNTGLTKHDNYALICFLYIHQNPVKAKLSTSFEGWDFSSYRDFIGLHCESKICNKRLAINLLDLPTSKSAFQEFSKQTLPEGYQDYIF